MPMPWSNYAVVAYSDDEMIVLDRLPHYEGPDNHSITKYTRERGYHETGVVWRGVYYEIIKNVSLDEGFFPVHAIDDPVRRAVQQARYDKNLAAWAAMWPDWTRRMAPCFGTKTIRHFDAEGRETSREQVPSS